jgi:hypothetical protein
VKKVLGETERNSLTSVIVAGEFARNPVVLKMVREAFPATFLTLADPHAATRGAVALTDRERLATAPDRESATSAASDGPVPPRQFVVRADLSRGPATPPVSTESGEAGLADGIINRVRELSRLGKRAEAEAELKRLQNYVDALELSLKDPAEALRPDGPRVDAGGTASRSESTSSVLDAPRPPVDEEKLKRREYLRARDEIIHAEQALKEGRLEQAIAYSHLAYKESADGRIFGAMIKVHLRAVRQPFTLQNFREHRDWLVCALQHDPTNEEVQAAVRNRYLAHAEALATVDAPPASLTEARRTLDELRLQVEPGEAALALIQRLGDAKEKTETPRAPNKAPTAPNKAPTAQAEAPNVQAEAPNVQAEAPNVQAEAPNVQPEAPNAQPEAPNLQPEAPKDQ